MVYKEEEIDFKEEIIRDDNFSFKEKFPHKEKIK